MGKKLDLDLAIKQGRFGEIAKYLDRRIDLLQKALSEKCKATNHKMEHISQTQADLQRHIINLEKKK